MVNKASKNVAYTSAELIKEYKTQIAALQSQLSMNVCEQRELIRAQLEAEMRGETAPEGGLDSLKRQQETKAKRFRCVGGQPRQKTSTPSQA